MAGLVPFSCLRISGVRVNPNYPKNVSIDVRLHIAPLPGWGGSAGVGLMTVEHGSEAKNRTLRHLTGL